MQNLYLGIDPGSGGGLALVGSRQFLTKMPGEEKALWQFMRKLGSSRLIKLAVIEQQTARPTRYINKKTKEPVSTILASTCILYGSYMQLRAMLCAADIPYTECPPKRWQKALGIPEKEKGEKDSQWKGKLKEKAQELYPDLHITLATADSLLLAVYARQVSEGGAI